MKELTIKKETLDVVRQMVADGQVSQEVAEKYFPEFRESESERIRKALKEYFINSFQNNGVAAICGVHIIDILAWLEKQGEQKPIEWDEYDEMYVSALIAIVRKEDATTQTLRDTLTGWLRCLKGRFKRNG